LRPKDFGGQSVGTVAAHKVVMKTITKARLVDLLYVLGAISVGVYYFFHL
jgi:hypothetical protein